MKQKIGKKKYILGSISEVASSYIMGARRNIQERKNTVTSIHSFSQWYIAINSDDKKHVYVLDYRYKSKICTFKKYGFYVSCEQGYAPITHRIGKPSMYVEGVLSFHVNGYKYTKTQEYCLACGFDDETTCVWILKYGEDLPEYSHDLNERD